MTKERLESSLKLPVDKEWLFLLAMMGTRINAQSYSKCSTEGVGSNSYCLLGREGRIVVKRRKEETERFSY